MASGKSGKRLVLFTAGLLVNCAISVSSVIKYQKPVPSLLLAIPSSEAVLAVTPVILQFVHPIGPMVSRSGGRTRHYRNRISLCITTPRPACEFGEATKAIKEIIIKLGVGEVGAFLIAAGNGPEKQELLRLIGTLV